MMDFDLTAEITKANTIIGVLSAAGYTEISLVGGALRVLALGGTTQDVDIAVIVDDVQDYINLREDMRKLIKPLYQDVCHMHDTCGYGGTDGFLGDWRVGNVNIIAYSKDEYRDLQELISRFDLNINQWYYDEDGDLVNDYFDTDTKVVKINPKRDKCRRVGRLDERIERFKADLPNLDWSQLHG